MVVGTLAKGTVQDMHGHDVDVIWVKGSGWDLATIEARDCRPSISRIRPANTR